MKSSVLAKTYLLLAILAGIGCAPPPTGDDLFAEKPPAAVGPNTPPIIEQNCAASLTQDAVYNCAPEGVDSDSGAVLSWTFGDGHTCGPWLSVHPSSGEITGLPTDEAVGDCTMVIKVKDERNEAAAAEVALSVANLPPTLSINPPNDIAQGASMTVLRTDAQVQASEEGFGVYSLLAATAPACADNGTLQIDAVTGKLSFQPNLSYSGTCSIKVQFDDENLQANSTVSVEIPLTVFANAAPVVDLSACSTNLNQDSSYNCTPGLADPDAGDSHTWSLGASNTCDWASVAPATGAISGTPNDDEVGTCTLAVKANDGHVDSPEDSMSVTVGNLAPALTITDAADIYEDSSATVIRADAAVQASEEGFGSYSLIAATAPACADNGTVIVHAVSGQVTYLPTPDYVGTCNIHVEFDDGNGEVNSTVSDEFSVTVLEQNDPPVITASCAASVSQDNAYNCTPGLTDSDSVSHTWSFAAGHTCGWASIVPSTGVISGTPDDDDVGDCNFAITANDGEDDSNVVNFTVTVTNTAPMLTIADAADISRDVPPTEIRTDGDVQASEEGFGTYSLTAATAPACADNGTVSVNSGNGAVTYEPAPAYTGTCNITVTFDDGNGQGNSTVTAELAITVLEIPPVVTGLANDATPTQSKTWNWGCNTTCEFRYVINTSPTHAFSAESYGATTGDAQSSGTNTYYLHVQARDINTLLESPVKSVLAIIDNTAPTDPSSLTLNGDMTETSADTLNWAASTDETALTGYEIKVGTTAGGNELVDWTAVGDVTSATLNLSVAIGVTYYSTIRAVDEAGNYSGEITSAGWVLPGPPNAVANLQVSSAKTTEITIGWSAPFDNGRAITDYFVEYKESSAGTYTVFADGVATDTVATVTGLTAETSYDFRVIAYNGASSPYSNVTTGETLVDDPFFEPDVYKAMNLGGATISAVAALEDGTTVILNGSPLTTLDAGETFGFASAQNDLIEADKPIFVAGRNGSGAATKKGNIVWNTPDWAGKEFIFTGTRNAPHRITVYAFQDSTIEVKNGSTVLDTQAVNSGSNHTFSINQNGGFTLTSTGSIIAYMYSSGSTSVIDPKPLLPAATDIIGVPSASAHLTTLGSGNNYTAIHSNSTAANGTLTAGNSTQINGLGGSSLYQGYSLRVTAATPIVANSYADSNGNCSAPFLPVGMMKKRYIVNVAAQWVAFVSLEPGTIDMIDPATGNMTQLTLVRSGSDPNAPYKAYTTSKAAGFRFESTVRFGAWYEPSTDNYGSNDDETIMFGAD